MTKKEEKRCLEMLEKFDNIWKRKKEMKECQNNWGRGKKEFRFAAKSWKIFEREFTKPEMVHKKVFGNARKNWEYLKEKKKRWRNVKIIEEEEKRSSEMRWRNVKIIEEEEKRSSEMLPKVENIWKRVHKNRNGANKLSEN